MLCEYGCGNKAIYVLSNGKNCCSKHYNSCPAIKQKNSDGIKAAYKSGKRKPAKLVYQELSDEAKSRMNWRKGIYDEDIFIIDSLHSTDYIKKRIIKEQLVPYKCKCGNKGEWQGQLLILELDHKNGIRNDNRLKNLRFLCPNCHSQTKTFRGRNINSGLKKVDDSELIDAIKSTKSIRQALIKVGLAPMGANYIRAKKIINQINGSVVKLEDTSDLRSDSP